MKDEWITPVELTEIFERHGELEGALLPVLHAIQDAAGHISSSVVPQVAQRLNLSRAEVHGVISYYHHFRAEPVAPTVVQLCRAEACQALGAEALGDHVQRKLGCAFHETGKDGLVTLEPVYCLGQCAVGPAMMVGDELYARVTPERFDEVLSRAVKEAS